VLPQEKKIIPSQPLTKEEEQLLARVDENKENLLQLLQKMIQIDSTNLSEKKFVSRDAIFDFVESYLKQHNFQTQIYRAPFSDKESYPNLIGWMDGSNPGPKLQFNGHLDIVPYADEIWDGKFSALSGIIENGKIYGRGACDMKGGVACQIVAMEILKKANIPFNGKLQIWLTPDEETHGTFGSLFMAKNHRAVIESDLSIIAEATAASPLQSPAIAIGEKGPLWLKLTFFGAAGHGSMPKAKSNAINKAVRFMANLKKYKLPKSPPPIGIIPLFKHLLGRYSIGDLLKVMKVAKTERNPYDEDGNSISALTHSTHSFGLFQSGSKVNVIPDEAELEVDFRLLPGIQLTEVMKNLQKYSANLGYHMKLPAEYSTEGTLAEKIKNRPVDIQVEILTWGEGSIEDMETSHYSIVKETFESAYHVHAVPAFSSGFTDAGNLRQAGLKNIFVVGPRGRNFHAENESVDIDSLISVTKFYLLLAYRFLTRSK